MIESPPMSAAAASTAARNASGSPTSTPKAIPPISFATASADSPLRSSTATRAPSSAIRRQVARPIPDPPPVTTALRPSSSPIDPSSWRVTVRPQRGLDLQRFVKLPDQQFLRHAQMQGAVLTVHRRPDGGPATCVHERVEIEDGPRIGPTGAVEPDGVIETGVSMRAPDAETVRTERGSGHVGEISQKARVHCRVVRQKLTGANATTAGRPGGGVRPLCGCDDLP